MSVEFAFDAMLSGVVCHGGCVTAMCGGLVSRVVV